MRLKILRGLEPVGLDVKIAASSGNLTGDSAASLTKRLSKFWANENLISRGLETSRQPMAERALSQ